MDDLDMESGFGLGVYSNQRKYEGLKTTAVFSSLSVLLTFVGFARWLKSFWYIHYHSQNSLSFPNQLNMMAET